MQCIGKYNGVENARADDDMKLRAEDLAKDEARGSEDVQDL